MKNSSYRLYQLIHNYVPTDSPMLQLALLVAVHGGILLLCGRCFRYADFARANSGSGCQL